MKKLFFTLLGLLAAVSMSAQTTPAEPTNVTWHDCLDESGYSYLAFTLPTEDIYGSPLDIELVGYRIYIDDNQIFTFTGTEYPNDGLWGNTTDIYYYQWSTGNDIKGDKVYFYHTNAEGFTRFFNTRIGIQAFYLNDDFTIGEDNVSKIVYTWVNTLPTPKNPIISEWTDGGAAIFDDGTYKASSEVMFEAGIDMYSRPVADDYTVMKEIFGEDYTVLDKAKLTYSLFTDNDKPFVFTPDPYSNLFEDVYPGLSEATQVPFGYAGGDIGMWEVHFNKTNKIDELIENGFEVEPLFTWRIGIKTYYTDNGNTTTSDIIYQEIFPQLKPAADVTATSFLADWSCDAQNTFMIDGFKGYDLYVVNKETQETQVFNDIMPVDTYQDEWGNSQYMPGSTYMVENLEPGTYQYYVIVNTYSGKNYQSVVREVTLGSHGYELGDVNHDHKVSIADVTDLINYLLTGDGSNICLICADVNVDGQIKIADVTEVITILLNQ